MELGDDRGARRARGFNRRRKQRCLLGFSSCSTLNVSRQVSSWFIRSLQGSAFAEMSISWQRRGQGIYFGKPKRISAGKARKRRQKQTCWLWNIPIVVLQMLHFTSHHFSWEQTFASRCKKNETVLRKFWSRLFRLNLVWSKCVEEELKATDGI